MNQLSSSDSPAIAPKMADSCPGLACAVLRGSFGFAAVSVAGFAPWALAGKWFYRHTGEAGLYLVCATIFLAGSGLILHPLVRGSGSLLRFYRIFVPAFFAYALTWCAAWFAWRFGAGEWLGSFAASVAFAAMVGRGFGNYQSIIKVSLVVFVLHSAGYFLGGKLMYWLDGPAAVQWLGGLSRRQISMLAKLSWGLLYGCGFGAGLGYAFFTFQRRGEAAQLG